MRGIFTAYFDFWRRAFDFKGRTNRFDWFFAGIIDLIIRIFLAFLISTKLEVLYLLISLVPRISVEIRRVRDYGKDWKWIFVNLIPVFGWLRWLVWCGFGASGSGPLYRNKK